MRTRMLLTMAACLGFLTAGAMAEQIDNMEYTNWAKFKPGTTVTAKSVSETSVQGMATPMKSEMTITTKLVDVTPTEATVETTMSMMNSGQKMDMPAQTRKVPAKMDKPAEAQTKMEMKDVKDGTDKVTISGKAYDTKTKEGTMEANGNSTKSKTWTSDEIPGGMAKMESTTTGGTTMTMKMEVTEVKMP